VIDSARDNLCARLIIIYNEYRTSCLNAKYYGCRLHSVQRTNFWLEVVVAAGTSAGIGGLTLLQSEPAHSIWTVIAAVSAVLAIVKPVANLSAKLSKYARLYGEYAKLTATIRTVVENITVTKDFLPEDERVYRSAQATFSELAKDDDPRPSRRLLTKLQNEVNNEISPETLWLPPASTEGAASHVQQQANSLTAPSPAQSRKSNP
jgi:hypothetical protein